MEWVEPPKLPSLMLPEAPLLPLPILEVPQADIPSYEPLVVPPNTLRPPEGIKGINSDPAPESTTNPTTTKPNIPDAYYYNHDYSSYYSFYFCGCHPCCYITI
jgi:hypothetical protein